MRLIIRILAALPAQCYNQQDRNMTTLSTPPVATLLTQLFRDAEQSSAALEQQSISTSAEERTRLMTSKTEYRLMYERMKDFHLAVSPATGTLLYMLARAGKACSIVEFGTSFGISTLHLAAALRDNGGGRIISTEFEPSKIAKAQGNIAAAGLADLVEIRAGDALQTLASGLPDHIDLVLLDGAKSLYPQVLALLEPRLRQGALIVADNADWCPEYLARVRAAGGGYSSVPFDSDVELSMKL
jgi:predicted O-methyltransferase YrrM